MSDGKSYLGIACNEGWIFLEKIKPEGKGVMAIRDFLNGQKLTPNTSTLLSKIELLG